MAARTALAGNARRGAVGTRFAPRVRVQAPSDLDLPADLELGRLASMLGAHLRGKGP